MIDWQLLKLPFQTAIQWEGTPRNCAPAQLSQTTSTSCLLQTLQKIERDLVLLFTFFFIVSATLCIIYLGCLCSHPPCLSILRHLPLVCFGRPPSARPPNKEQQPAAHWPQDPPIAPINTFCPRLSLHPPVAAILPPRDTRRIGNTCWFLPRKSPACPCDWSSPDSLLLRPVPALVVDRNWPCPTPSLSLLPATKRPLSCTGKVQSRFALSSPQDPPNQSARHILPTESSCLSPSIFESPPPTKPSLPSLRAQWLLSTLRPSLASHLSCPRPTLPNKQSGPDDPTPLVPTCLNNLFSRALQVRHHTPATRNCITPN